MTRLTSLVMFGVAVLAVSGTVRADDATNSPNPSESYITLQHATVDGPYAAATDANALAPSAPLVDIELGIGLQNPSPVTTEDVAAPLSASNTFGRDLLIGLGDADRTLDGRPFVGTLIELADTFSLATLIRADDGRSLSVDPRAEFSSIEEPPGSAWFIGLQASYRPSDQLTIGLNYGLLREVDRMLGTPTSAELSGADEALTQSLGLGVSYVFNDRLSATVFYDHVRMESESADLTHFGGSDTLVGQKLGASVELSRIFTPTDRLSFAALQPFNVYSLASRAAAVGDDADAFGLDDPISMFLDPQAIPLTLSFSYMDEGATIPRGLTFSLEDDDVRDRDGLNVSAMATVKVPF